MYRWLWEHIGGRPWTFIIRDSWHKYEFLWIVLLVSAGIYLGHAFTWKMILIGWLIFTLGYMFGHFFWGSQYIEGQKGDE